MNSFKMKCQLCHKEFFESEIDESHDVPCYLFEGYNRKQKKQKADKYPRHYLCKQCYEAFEDNLRAFLIKQANEFSKFFWGEHGFRNS